MLVPGLSQLYIVTKVPTYDILLASI